MGLTKKQRALVEELDEISEELGLDYWRFVDDPGVPEFLTTYLEIAWRHYIRSAVLTEYTLLDEYLGSVIARYFFGAKRPFNQLWRTKRFQRFNFFMLEKLSLLHKLALVQDIMNPPRAVVSHVRAVNDVRNAFAHALFPENLRGERTKYKGKDLFSMEGFRLFWEARKPSHDFFMRRLFGLRP